MRDVSFVGHDLAVHFRHPLHDLQAGRFIGRRALGAKKKDIVIQFLIETVMLSGAGGVIGVVVGLAIPLQIALGY